MKDSRLSLFPFPQELLNQARELRLAKSDRLFSMDDPVGSLYFVIEGEIRAVRCLLNGSESIMLRAGPGEFLAIASLFLPTYPCDAVASMPSKLLVLPRQKFKRAMDEDISLTTSLVRMLAVNIETQCGRVERLRLKRICDRVMHYLTCECSDGTVHLQTPLTAWAAELGSEPETLYRVLRELEKDGTIMRDGRTIGLARD